MLGDAIQAAAQRFAAAGVPSPDVDARLIAAHLLGVGHMQLGNYRDDPVPEGFAEAVARRERREPLQHILGTAPFGHVDLAVGPGVFIPRPETEVLADWAVGQLHGLDNPTVIDFGTGSGALAIYIATLVPAARVFAVEKQASALDWARRNVDKFAPHVQLINGDVTDPALLGQLRGSVDLVVANPPYVPETGDLNPEVYIDPPEAVFSGVDGMETITAMLPQIAALLRPGGVTGIEHDDSTSEAVQDAIRAHGGFAAPEVLTDLTGRARFVSAVRVSSARHEFTPVEEGERQK